MSERSPSPRGDTAPRSALSVAAPGGLRARLVLTGDGAEDAAARLALVGVPELLAQILSGALEESSPSAPVEPLPAPSQAAPEQNYGGAPASIPSAVLRTSNSLRAGTLASREERIKTAYRLGRADALQALAAQEGGRVFTTPTPASPAGTPPGRQSFWAVLHHPTAAPGWLADRDQFFDLVRPGGNWLPSAIGRGFCSRAELDAYLAGANPNPALTEWQTTPRQMSRN